MIRSFPALVQKSGPALSGGLAVQHISAAITRCLNFGDISPYAVRRSGCLSGAARSAGILSPTYLRSTQPLVGSMTRHTPGPLAHMVDLTKCQWGFSKTITATELSNQKPQQHENRSCGPVVNISYQPPRVSRKLTRIGPWKTAQTRQMNLPTGYVSDSVLLLRAQPPLSIGYWGRCDGPQSHIGTSYSVLPEISAIKPSQTNYSLPT